MRVKRHAAYDIMPNKTADDHLSPCKPNSSDTINYTRVRDA
jgi:hypothetical protein